MSWVVIALRKQELRNRINDLTTMQIAISQEIMDLQKYGSNIADGVITAQEGASVPSRYFGTQMDFINNSSSVAYMSATDKTDAYLTQMQELAANTGKQYNYTVEDMTVQPALLFNEIYKNELEEYARMVTAQINEKEKALEGQKLTLETQLKAAQAEYESISQSLDNNIKDSAIKLA